MKRFLSISVLALLSTAVDSQPAEREIDGVNAECVLTFASFGDQLTLHREPDLRSESAVIPYGVDWEIPVDSQSAITRILSYGLLRVLASDDEMHCPVQPTEVRPETRPGDLVELLYHLGEGSGVIRIGDAECAVVVGNPRLFEQVQPIELQAWNRVLFADGTSPGWLHFDYSQAYVYRCRG